MKHSFVVRMALLTVGLGGCYPVEQAPLVYSSRSEFGIGVSAGMPDSPGLDINIGYKGADAAFVPVAVAKRCRPENRVACERATHDIMIVKGVNQVSGRKALDDRMIDQYRATIAASTATIKQLSEQIGAKKAQLATLVKRDDKQTELDALSADGPDGAARVLTPEQIAAKATLEAELAAVDGLDEGALTNEVKGLEASNRAAADELVDAQQALQSLLNRPNQQSGDDKMDAFSVYGSFNGDANGSDKGAALKLGKVFSTGIAAQNLSQGIGAGTRIEARGKCLTAMNEAIAAITPDSDRAAARTKLLAYCGAE